MKSGEFSTCDLCSLMTLLCWFLHVIINSLRRDIYHGGFYLVGSFDDYINLGTHTEE